MTNTNTEAKTIWTEADKARNIKVEAYFSFMDSIEEIEKSIQSVKEGARFMFEGENKFLDDMAVSRKIPGLLDYLSCLCETHAGLVRKKTAERAEYINANH